MQWFRAGRIIFYLIVGMVTSIGVAWYCATQVEPVIVESTGQGGFDFKRRQVFDESQTAVWWTRIFRCTGGCRVETEPLRLETTHDLWLAAVTPEQLRADGMPQWTHLSRGLNPPVEKGWMVAESGFGWPALALRYEERSRLGQAIKRTGGLDAAPLLRWDRELIVPLTPIWSGLVVNSLFFGAIWLTIGAGPFVVRRIVRQRTGRCVACGYNMNHNAADRCPECGKTVVSRS